MQAGMPAKSCRKGLTTRQLEMREAAEETQWSFLRYFLTSSGAYRPRRVCATAINTPALIDCFAQRQKLKWKTLQRDRMRESRASEVQIPRQTKREKSIWGLLLAASGAFVLWSRPDPAKGNLAVPRQRNEPRRLITYLTYQICLFLVRSWPRKAVSRVHLKIKTEQIIHGVCGSLQPGSWR